MSILSGVRVLDLTHYIAGPYCSQILADHGAEVIKIERLDGEVGRMSNPFHNDVSLYFVSENRNKKGLSLDLKTSKGKEIFRRLVETAEVLVTNYGAEVPERLGIGFEEISAINPKISMVHITGFGTTGPYKNYAAYDGVIQSMSGLAELTGHPDGPPTIAGFFIADHIAGLQAAMGAMLALFNQKQTGKGSFVDISMLDGMISLLGFSVAEAKMHGIKQHRLGTQDRFQVSRAFPAKSGCVFISGYLTGSSEQWQMFSKLIGKSEWGQSDSPFYTIEGRLESREVVEEAIAMWTSQHIKEEVFHLLQKIGIASGPVNNLDDVVHDVQVKNRNMIQSVNMGEAGDVFVPGVAIKIKDNPLTGFDPPPELGENSEEILAELGFSKAEIDNFKMDNIIKIERNNCTSIPRK